MTMRVTGVLVAAVALLAAGMAAMLPNPNLRLRRPPLPRSSRVMGSKQAMPRRLALRLLRNRLSLTRRLRAEGADAMSADAGLCWLRL